MGAADDLNSAGSAAAGDDGVGRQQGRHLPDDSLRLDGIGLRFRATFQLLSPKSCHVGAQSSL